MGYLLNLLYLLAITIASPWLVYSAWRQGKYREGYAEKFWGKLPRRRSDRPGVWFHAVSVGEVNLLRTVIEAWKKRHPEWECVITTTTKTGYDLACQKFPADTVAYCPLDFSWAVAEAFRRVRPQLLVLVELELWPNLIAAAKSHGCRVAIVNGRLSEKSFRGYHRLRWFLRPTLRKIDLIVAQDAEYADRFRKLAGVNPDGWIQVSGSIKFDGVRTSRGNPETERLRRLAGIAESDVVFLAGSTQHPEEQLALRSYLELVREFPRLRLILVPRHVTRADEVAAELDAASVNGGKLAWQRRIALERDGALSDARVLLVDTIGELSAWWGTATIAYVGGSMGSRGGQNMLEPAAYGAAVCFGPNTRNFRDIVRMLRQANGAEVVADGAALTAFARRCLTEPDWARELGERSQRLVISQQGALARTLDYLAPIAAPSRREAA